MARVFVTRELPGPALARLQAAHDTTIWSERTAPSYDQLRDHAQAADGLLTLLTDRIDSELIAAAPQLKVISNYAVGYDNIDTQAAAQRGIAVGHTPEVLTDATADLAWALLMAVARKLPAATAAVQQQAWDGWQPLDYLGAEVHGATLGIIGLGRIGRAVADRAEGFKMRILEAGRGEFQPLKYLLANSDFVSLHAPLTPETHHLIDAEALALMKPTAYLINTSRGGVIDQQALLVALNNQQIAGAALDVTDPEPLPPDHQLLSAPNLLITPHIGSATDVARAKMTEIAVDNLLAGLASEPLAHAVPPAG